MRPPFPGRRHGGPHSEAHTSYDSASGAPRRARHHHPDPAEGTDGDGAGRPGPRGRGRPGPGGPFGPAGPFGPGGPAGRRGRGGRVPRGDVRAAVLLLLAEEPMHGYQLMHTIGDRTGGRWTPSPGAVYPTLAALEDEGLVSVTAESGRKLATLTEAGRAHVEASRAGWPDPFAGPGGEPAGPDLRELLEQLHGAVRQVGRSGTDAQRAAAATVLAGARRSLYLLLADGPDGPDRPDGGADGAPAAPEAPAT